MNSRLLSLLVCPDCGGELELFVFSSRGEGRTEDGYLRCAGCGGGFMVVGGIPRMLPEKLYRNDEFMDKYGGEISALTGVKIAARGDNLSGHKQRTMDGFGWEWKNYNRFGWDEKTQQSDWDAANEWERFWISTLYKPEDLKDKLVLDGGCGNGRYMFQSIKRGAEVVGIDLSQAIEVAYENLREYKQGHFVQADLFHLPFRTGSFDAAFSLGVLMHTGDAHKAFVSLADKVKTGGLLSACIYQKQNPLHEFNDKWLRAFSVRFSKGFLHDLSCVLEKFARAAWKVRLLGLINAFCRLEPYEQCIYDWYQAPMATHHTYQEVEKWFREVGAVDIRNDSSYDTRDSVRKWIWPRCGFTVRGRLSVNSYQ
jgi:SAM-dependent methyltransferase/uncharacterized protein YbaR (Trm112 family)